MRYADAPSKGTDGEDVHLAAADIVWQCNALDAFAALHGNLHKEDINGEGLAATRDVAISHLFGDDFARQQRRVATIERPIAEAQRKGLRRAVGVCDRTGPAGRSF